jgi:hypothetical protein
MAIYCRLHRHTGHIEATMDFLYIALLMGFFGLTVGLIRFCAALMDKGGRS